MGCLAGEESWEKQERGRSWEMPGSTRQRGLSVDITAKAGQGLRSPGMEKLGMERGLDLSYPSAEHPLPAPCADPGGLGSLWMQRDPVAGKEHSSPPNLTGSPGAPMLGVGAAGTNQSPGKELSVLGEGWEFPPPPRHPKTHSGEQEGKRRIRLWTSANAPAITPLPGGEGCPPASLPGPL